MYGNRCNFKHFEIKTETTSHYYEKLFYLEKYTPVNKRLSIFIEITNDYKVNSLNSEESIIKRLNDILTSPFNDKYI